jgi:hypothetical protein
MAWCLDTGAAFPLLMQVFVICHYTHLKIELEQTVTELLKTISQGSMFFYGSTLIKSRIGWKDLTPWITALPEDPIVTHLVKSPTFYRT